ncbi:MAG: DUF3618 domain-containing protein [Nocardioides sp.]
MGESTDELTTDIADTRQALASDLDALQDRVSPSAVIERRKAAVRGRFGSTKDRVMGSSQTSGGSSGVAGLTSSARDTAGGVANTVEDKVDGSPLAAGLVAFGLGAVIAGLMPATEKETQAAQALKDAAQEHGQPVIDSAKEAAREVGDTLKESGAQAVAEVKDTAQESAARVQDQASGSSPTSGASSLPTSTQL